MHYGPGRLHPTWAQRPDAKASFVDGAALAVFTAFAISSTAAVFPWTWFSTFVLLHPRKPAKHGGRRGVCRALRVERSCRQRRRVEMLLSNVQC
eukprot:scaffold319_cov362-Pavlova_lutheri.AAC.4